MNDIQLISEVIKKFCLYLEELVDKIQNLISLVEECFEDIDCAKAKRIIPIKKIKPTKTPPVYRVRYHARSDC